jgi:hypothetical protein
MLRKRGAEGGNGIIEIACVWQLIDCARHRLKRLLRCFS